MYWDDEVEFINTAVECPFCKESMGIFMRKKEMKYLWG